jgi:hypothetical protein
MFTLTQAGTIEQGAWEATPAQFPIDEIYAQYIRDLEQLQKKYNLRNALCPDNFRGNTWSTELLNKIVEYSRTSIRVLVTDESSEKGEKNIPVIQPQSSLPTIAYYTYLELYKKVFSAAFIGRIRVRYEEIKSKAAGRRRARLEEVGVKIKGVPLRSFHILDDGADSSRAFRIICNFIESETGSSIAWNHLSTYSDARNTYDRIEHVKDSTHWTKGVDGSDCNLANIRAWKNKITTVLKNVDVIVVNAISLDTCSDKVNVADGEVDNTACAIAFALMNVNVDGTAIINLRVSSLVHASTVSLIHLFSRSFNTVNVIHTVADDRLFLCGVEYKGNIISRQWNHLLAVCESRLSLFSTEYMNGADFTNTVEKLIDIMRAATVWRLAQYQKLFTVYEKISGSLSSKMITGHVERILAEYYPDDSKQWKEKVGL